MPWWQPLQFGIMAVYAASKAFMSFALMALSTGAKVFSSKPFHAAYSAGLVRAAGLSAPFMSFDLYAASAQFPPLAAKYIFWKRSPTSRIGIANLGIAAFN